MYCVIDVGVDGYSALVGQTGEVGPATIVVLDCLGT